MEPQESVRQHTTEIEIKATPDQVFREVSEAEGIMRWFAPIAKVDPRVGGEYVISWGPGMEGKSTITIYEPGKRFAAATDKAKPYSAGPAEPDAPARLVVDYQIEAIGGGMTRLRLVHSGFGRGAGWDNDFEGTRTGWPVFMQVLKHGLERHPGVASLTTSVMVPCPIPAEEAWKRLVKIENSRYRVAAGPGLEFHGETRVVDPPGTLIGVAEEFDDALAGLYCGFHGKFVNLTLVLYGPARQRSEQIGSDWKAGLTSALA